MKKAKAAPENAPAPRRNYFADVTGIGLVFVTLYLLLALVSYSPGDAGESGVVRNWAGLLGHWPVHHAVLFCGIGSIPLVLFPAAIGVALVRRVERRRAFLLVLGFAAIIVALASLARILLPPFVNIAGYQVYPDGWLGIKLGSQVMEYANAPGAFLLFSTLLFLGVLWTTGIRAATVGRAIGKVIRLQLRMVRGIGAWFSKRMEQKRRHKEFLARRLHEAAQETSTTVTEPTKPVRPAKPARTRKKAAKAADDVGDPFDDEPAAPAKFTFPEKKGPVEIRRREAPKVQRTLNLDVKSGRYSTPPIDLLTPPPASNVSVDRKGIEMNSRLLEKKLGDFNVTGAVVAVQPGPVVTMYEVEPGAGVKVSKFVNLTDDLAMAMRAVSIRVVAPIPGKNAVGIEIPNQQRESVYLSEIISSSEFQNGKAKIPIALGKDITGQPVVSDLAQMPHLLVAGQTGSGKSVGLNGMICSMLYRFTPDRLKFVMIDPKMIELSAYDGIPHLRIPVITNPKKAAIALRRCVDEMEKRYELMKAVGRAKDLDTFNKRVEEMRKAKGVAEITVPNEGPEGGETTLELEPLPYWVIILDELADLMVVAKKDIEDSIARLTAKARAAGMHLIVATQRPSVDVITGVIKSNLPTRLSFQVASGIDSKTILDTPGAENLLGQGDSLFIPPKTSRLVRVHGAYVTEDEIGEIVEYLRTQGAPDYDEALLQAKPGEGDEAVDAAAGDEERDALYDHVVQFVMDSKRASTSAIQRKFSIGYNRAARILDQMQADGLVGPPNGSNPREILRESI